MVAKPQFVREYDKPMAPSNGETVGQFPEYLKAIQALSKEIILSLICKKCARFDLEKSFCCWTSTQPGIYHDSGPGSG